MTRPFRPGRYMTGLQPYNFGWALSSARWDRRGGLLTTRSNCTSTFAFVLFSTGEIGG
jgi:hypothetical protein